jgi:hypothetical protein
MNFFVDVSAAFGGIKPLGEADSNRGKGLSREKQSPKKKFYIGGGEVSQKQEKGL